MLNSTIQHALAQYRRSVLLIGAPILLSACVAAPVENTSSSSEAAASSETLVSSSSEMVASVSSSAAEVSSSVMAVSSSSVAISSSSMAVQSSSSEVVVSSSVQPVSSSSLMPSSSSVASSSSEIASSSSQVQSSSSAAVSMLSCDVSVAQHAYYLNLDLVTVSNDGSADLASWEVSFDFWFTPQNPNFMSLNGTQANYELNGQTLTVTGGALAAGEAGTFSFGANTGTADTPDVVCNTGGESSSSESSDTSSSVAPPPPVLGSGIFAQGLCAANTGLGNGSGGQHASYVVFDDGSVAKAHGETADFLVYGANSAQVQDAIAVSNGGYGGQFCMVNTVGEVLCDQYQDSTTVGPDKKGGPKIAAFIASDGKEGSTCAITDAGELACAGHRGDMAVIDFGGETPVAHLGCGRDTGCCVIDDLGDVYCRTGSSGSFAKKESVGIAQIIGANDQKHCAVYDNGRTHCWGPGDAIAAAEGFSVSNPVVSYTGGQFLDCWLLGDTTVACSGADAGESSDVVAAGLTRVLFEGSALTDIIAISGNKDSTCAVNGTGELFCWASKAAEASKVDTGGKKVRMPTDCAM